MLKKLTLLVLVGVGVAAATATIAFGGGTARLPMKAESPQPRAVHPVRAPSALASKRPKAHRARVLYFETDPFAIAANGRNDSSVRCPRGTTAINGYFGTDGGIVEDYSAVSANLRSWEFGLIDLTGQDGSAFIGVVCFKR
jgi:hypothetical protein